MEKKHYPIFATDVMLTVNFIVDMPADSFQRWLDASTPYGRQRRNEEIKQRLLDKVPSEESDGFEKKPVNTSLVTQNGEKQVPEIMYFDCYPMANDRCMVTGVCMGIFTRRSFDLQLVQVGEAFNSVRDDLGKIVNDPEKGKYFPALSEMWQIWNKNKLESKHIVKKKDLNSSFLYGVEGLKRIALGRWSNDVRELSNCLESFSSDNEKNRFEGCVFVIPEPIELDAYNSKVWLIHGTNPDDREAADPFGKIRILPRADEGIMVQFWHDTAVENSLASYDYIRKLCQHLRVCGMVFESDIPGQVQLGLETISTSIYLQSKFRAVKNCLLNIKAPPAFLQPRGIVEASPIGVKRLNETSCELSVDGLYHTPKWTMPEESIHYLQEDIISILLLDVDPHTKIEINCRHDAFLPFVIQILEALKALPSENGDVIQREINRLMFVDTYSDVDETAVAHPKKERIVEKQKKAEIPDTIGDLSILDNVALMKKHYKDYSKDTATRIIKALEKAFADYCDEGGTWGPGKFEKYCFVSATTIGRYLKVFRIVGIVKINGIDLPKGKL